MEPDIHDDSNGALHLGTGNLRPVSAREVLGIAGLLLVCALVSQFGVASKGGPGFTYLAVVLAVCGLGALLAAGLVE